MWRGLAHPGRPGGALWSPAVHARCRGTKARLKSASPSGFLPSFFLLVPSAESVRGPLPRLRPLRFLGFIYFETSPHWIAVLPQLGSDLASSPCLSLPECQDGRCPASLPLKSGGSAGELAGLRSGSVPAAHPGPGPAARPFPHLSESRGPGHRLGLPRVGTARPRAPALPRPRGAQRAGGLRNPPGKPSARRSDTAFRSL